jgi:hypothetical protein
MAERECRFCEGTGRIWEWDFDGSKRVCPCPVCEENDRHERARAEAARQFGTDRQRREAAAHRRRFGTRIGG